jgi:hypothetical protein
LQAMVMWVALLVPPVSLQFQSWLNNSNGA